MGIKKTIGTLFVAAVMAFALASSVAFADERETAPTPAGSLNSAPTSSTLQAADVAPKAERTVLMYICGSDLEGAGLATFNLKQVLESNFSKDGKVRYVVMTGGTDSKWAMESEYLCTPDGGEVSRIDKKYNQVWEARGKDDATHPSKMVLLEEKGISGKRADEEGPDQELMSDPETLKAFINYGVEHFPAEKYDLILWNHGGGPVDGYAIDEHKEVEPVPESEAEFEGQTRAVWMSFTQIVEALSDNDVTRNGGMFDFIDFDTCLMGSAELTLAVAGYTDYYIASAETEPGWGQDYRRWVSTIGSNPNYDTFELGKIIVDDYAAFYQDETHPEYMGLAVLAVIDMKKLLANGFVSALNEMDQTLKSEVNPQAGGEYLFYDELISVEGSLMYSPSISAYRDLGNLAAQLCIALKEVSASSIEDGSYTILNRYKDCARAMCAIFGNEDIIYARGTHGMTASARPHIDKDGALQTDELITSGMYVFMPTMGGADETVAYYDAVKGVIDGGKVKDEAGVTFLSNHVNTVVQYALIAETGKAVSALVDAGVSKQDINYAKVKEYWESHTTPVLGPSGEVAVTPFIWAHTILPLFERYPGGQDAAVAWLTALIDQQAGDAADKDNITAKKIIGKNGDSYRVRIEHTDKKVVDSVDTIAAVELPAAEEYLAQDKQTRNILEEYQGTGDHKLRVGKVPGQQDYSDLSIDINDPKATVEQLLKEYLTWYTKDESSWDLEQSVDEIYVVRDANGGLHAAQAKLSYDGHKAFVPFNYSQKNGTLVFERKGGEYQLTQIYLTNDLNCRPVNPAALSEALEGKTTYAVEYTNARPFVTMTKSSFTISKESGGSIRLELRSIDEIDDVADTDGDGKVVYEEYVVNDMYHNNIKITDVVKAADSAEDKLYNIELCNVEPVVYNGKKQGPKVTYEGQVLKEGQDYIWKDWGDSGSCVDPGKYDVTLFGKGRFAGRLQVRYTIQKVANPLEDKGKTAKVKYKDLKVKAQTLKASKVIKFTKKGQGMLSYKLASAKKGKRSFKGYFKVNAKTGKVTVKKKLDKGTYKLKIKVKAAGNANYKASAWKPAAVVVRVV